MTTTALFDVRDRVVAMLTSAALDPGSALHGWPVARGWPRGGLQRSHVVVAGHTEEWFQRYGVSGAVAKDENATLPIGVYRQVRTGDFADPEQAVRDVIVDIMALVSADITLGGTVMLAHVERGQVEEAIVDETHREVMATIYLRYDAHLD